MATTEKRPRPRWDLGPIQLLDPAGLAHVIVLTVPAEQTGQAQQAEEAPVIEAVVLDISCRHPLRRGLRGEWPDPAE